MRMKRRQRLLAGALLALLLVSAGATAQAAYPGYGGAYGGYGYGWGPPPCDPPDPPEPNTYPPGGAYYGGPTGGVYAYPAWGWRSYSQQSVTTPKAPAYQRTSGYSAYIANCDEWVNVRSGPGKSYDAVGRAYLGDTVTVLQWQNGWAECRYSGNATGWISGSFISTK